MANLLGNGLGDSIFSSDGIMSYKEEEFKHSFILFSIEDSSNLDMKSGEIDFSDC